MEEIWCKECGRPYQEFKVFEEKWAFIKELESRNELGKFMLKHTENNDRFHILFPNGKVEFVTQENIHEYKHIFPEG